MDRNESHMNVKLGKTDARSPSRAEPDVSYAELNFKTRSAPRVRKDREDPNSTYSDLNFRKKEIRIDQREDPPIASAPGGLSTTAQTAAQEQESKVKIGNRPYSLICLLCLITSALMVVVVGLSIHVSQIRQSYETWHRNSNLSDLKRMNNNLRLQFTEMETKYRSVKETKAEICELLTSRREPDSVPEIRQPQLVAEQTCVKDWVTNKDQCYYVSTFDTTFQKAEQECSNRDSRLLEINSSDEAFFVFHNLLVIKLAYWIEKCENGTVGRSLLYKHSGAPVCRRCGSGDTCDVAIRNFICEKSAPLIPDVPEKIQGLCQLPVEST
ncbi:oxidized low-density lipoprotein receptor 1-like [Hypanus sabinus]|uniref:oxidized low-density lipoprotein receptor 1-like n=1 Tax=Hypanus sabinus TaxID=79690 RepID=UPI0028C4543D|nr:oxidized low-density lipoprotein receptor 1-like [Hypanus sabinus]